MKFKRFEELTGSDYIYFIDPKFPKRLTKAKIKEVKLNKPKPGLCEVIYFRFDEGRIPLLGSTDNVPTQRLWVNMKFTSVIGTLSTKAEGPNAPIISKPIPYFTTPEELKQWLGIKKK